MDTEQSKDTPLVAVEGQVQGRVQGVSFRYSMQRAAADLGVHGWVRNLPDRSVAFHAEGHEDAVQALLVWTRTGPAYARVDDVVARSCEVAYLDSFEILR